jgi:DNA-binding MarR family transcriptional regulator
MRRAARAVTQLYDDALRPMGLRATQFTILQVLERGGEVTQGQLAEYLAIDSTTLTRTLKLLLDEGWIASRPGDDRRERHLSLTRSGKRQVEIALPSWRDAQARLQRMLGTAGWNELISALDRATQAARDVQQG